MSKYLALLAEDFTYLLSKWQCLHSKRKSSASNRSGLLKVNVGCGTTIAEGWVNFDNSPNLLISKIPGLRWLLYQLRLLDEFHYQISWNKKVILNDTRAGLPLPDESVDAIYASHFLEHLTYENATYFLQECFRVLKPGGIIRLVVPDLWYSCQQYLLKHKNAHTFMEDMMISGRSPHRWMYDDKSLTYFMERVGFCEVSSRQHMDSAIEGILALEVHRGEGNLWVEGVRPLKK